ncbi:hypothetical protein V9T40_011228 [Parthenolecanium corni]|uniref:Uncharacterized protein n=1 Tax=Parthenolecanium corni TaxID=536013 RepID=A0AAN9T4Z5_9HEMI
MDPPVTAHYQKPFYLFYYNKPKQPPLKKVKHIDYKQKPDVPVRLNNATKMRNKVIREYTTREREPYIDFKALTQETAKAILDEPKIVPRDTKASQFRYKWVRDVPVVSCRFTEHVMMFRKPPFTYEKASGQCGQYRMRTMELKAPEKSHESDGDALIPGILQ